MNIHELASETVKAFFKSNNEYKKLSDSSFKSFLNIMYREGLATSNVGEMKEYSVLVDSSILIYCTDENQLYYFSNEFMRSAIADCNVELVMVFCFGKGAQIKRLSRSKVFKN